MALHPDFPSSPHEELDPSIRWFPADEALRETSADRLMPPLVAELRKKVKEWRDSDYVGASKTSYSLIKWWFDTPHLKKNPDGTDGLFKYYFAQREAIETIIYLHDVVGVKDRYDLMRFDSSGNVRANMFDESWVRYVVKMATGSGKTKILSLVLVWSFFHKTYEEDSDLSRNFLVIAPNIIVLDRIYKDFQGLRIFLKDDPMIPDNGFMDANWREDFQLTLHLQDEIGFVPPTGNIFLTNIHRVYSGNEHVPSMEDEDLMDFFLGSKPVGGTTDSKVDLGVIVRDINELMILNDEAHHIHDPSMAWFKSIEDIHNRLLQKGGKLSLQIDVTATPKHSNGAIFVQTIADYPLVEAISQNVVKHPVLPDAVSRAKLVEKKSSKFTEKYADYLNLGVIEWRKSYEENIKLNKKSILFVMTDDTHNCDDVAEFLENTYQDLKGAVLVIHTKNNGEISEASSGKSADELVLLRKQANEIDGNESPYKAIVSVMVLKEGWDVRNVTTIVGLRAYSAKSNILPEQTLGRGLRKMYAGNIEESVSVVGTNAFMEFVESIQAEGVVLEHKPMGEGSAGNVPIIIEIENENPKKDIDNLDIEIPVLSNRIYREYKNISQIDVRKISTHKVPYKDFTLEEQREIVFKEITTGEISHITNLETSGVADYRSVLGYFAQTIMKELRLFTGYELLYPKVKEFIKDELFGKTIDLEDPNTLRNLSELEATKTIIESFKKAINDLTVTDKGEAEIRDYIKLRNTRPFAVSDQGYLVPRKSVFNKIIGDSHLELLFARFLDDAEDVEAFAKNYLSVNFKIDYINADGGISNYYPDFLVRSTSKDIFIIETKGAEDLDDKLKIERLKSWCVDINKAQNKAKFDFVYVDQESFERYKPQSLSELVGSFKEHKE
jgi:type III restriction enzyme